MFGGNFAPAEWMFCQGQVLAISEYDTLFQLIGTTYGGDGQSTFQLPDLQSRIPTHRGNRILAENGGTETVTLTVNQLPLHTHPMRAADAVGYASEPRNNYPAEHRDFPAFDAVANTPMNAAAAAPAGGSQQHNNMAPALGVSFIISLFGIFPPRN